MKSVAQSEEKRDLFSQLLHRVQSSPGTQGTGALLTRGDTGFGVDTGILSVAETVSWAEDMANKVSRRSRWMVDT